MSKIAFMFPGQGSYEAGMGRDVAEEVPEAMAVYEAGSAASGLDLKQICFHDPVENLLDTKLQQPALVATSLAINEAIRARGIHPDFVVGHSVGEFAALGAAESIAPADAIGLVTERGIAMSEAARERPGSMAAILGLADEVVERAADKLRPAVERIHFADPRTAFMSTVTAKLEDAGHYRELLVRQLTAPVKFTQAAGELIGKGVTVFVEVGPGNVLSGLLKRIDRSVRTVSVSDMNGIRELEKTLA